MSLASETDSFEKIVEFEIKDATDIAVEGFIVIDNFCEGACIESGTYEHYINCKIVENDLHGAGAFILMCSEMELYNEFNRRSVI